MKVGDEIETYIIRVNDVEGYAMLSKKRLDAVKVWDDVAEAGIAYLPSNASSNRANNGWIGDCRYNGFYLCSDITSTDTSKAQYASILFKMDKNPYEWYLTSTATACGIRLVKEIK